MLASKIIEIVRVQIGDSVATYRWSDAALLNYLNEAQRLICSVHPEASYLTGIGNGIPTDTSALTSSIGVEDIYMTALINYISYRVLLESIEDANNSQLSSAFYQNFMAAMN